MTQASDDVKKETFDRVVDERDRARLELADLRQAIRGVLSDYEKRWHGGGDRPPSPPAAVIEFVLRIEDALAKVAEWRGDRLDALVNLVKRAEPIRKYYDRRSAWDGGCALPSGPSDGEILDFRDAMSRLDALDRST